MTKAIGYIRVSTNEQGQDGHSLGAQRAKIEAYAALYELELIEVIEDAGVSAKTLNRPGLQRALEMLATGEADALIIFKLDRLTRSVADWATLIDSHFKGNSALLSVSDQIDTRTAAGRLVLNVLISVAQWEREAIGERTSVALRHKQSKGEHVGSAPYGFKMTDKKLERVETEHEAIALIQEMRAAGKTLQQVADVLNSQGIATQRGGKWHPTTVKNVLGKVAA